MSNTMTTQLIILAVSGLVGWIIGAYLDKRLDEHEQDR